MHTNLFLLVVFLLGASAKEECKDNLLNGKKSYGYYSMKKEDVMKLSDCDRSISVVLKEPTLIFFDLEKLVQISNLSIEVSGSDSESTSSSAVKAYQTDRPALIENNNRGCSSQRNQDIKDDPNNKIRLLVWKCSEKKQFLAVNFLNINTKISEITVIGEEFENSDRFFPVSKGQALLTNFLSFTLVCFTAQYICD